MDLKITSKKQKIQANITISGSKSESNRLLVLQQLYPNITINNISDSDDTYYLKKGITNTDELINISHAGTAMRFLTAFFATKEGETKILEGSERMHERPIKILVEALQKLGAKIEYVEKEGYPPLKIKGQKITSKTVEIQGNVSSQYISALMLIAPSLPEGLEINLQGEITSIPYIEMTLSLLKTIGVQANFEENRITILPSKVITQQNITVESDWSSASYYYALIALSDIESEITLSFYKKNSLQGDACLAEIYQKFGVETDYLKNKIVLKKKAKANREPLNLDLRNAPDIAQTIAVTCFGLGIACNLQGLHTLKIKETDRLVALKNELEKFSAKIEITTDSFHLQEHTLLFNKNKSESIKTYNDHRMAMAFAPLALKVPLTILNAEVVTKSYQKFWEDLNKIGIIVQEINS